MKTFNYKQTLLSMKKFYTITMCALAAFMFISVTTAAQATWNGTVNNNWSNPLNWSTLAVPTAATTVTIPNSASKTALTVDATANCASIVIQTGANNFTLTIANGQTLNVSGNLNIQSPTANNISKVVNLGNAASVLNAGSITLDDVVNGTNRDTRINVNTGTANVSGNITLNCNVVAENRIVLTSGLLSIGGTFSANGTFTRGTGTVDYNGAAQAMRADTYFNLIASGSGSKTGAVTINAGTISLKGTATIGTAVTYAGNGETLEYNGSAAQTTGTNEFPSTMATDVIINNASGVTLNAAKANFTGNLTLADGVFATGNFLTIGAAGTPLITLTGGSMSGNIQGANNYDVTYSGNSKTATQELSGSALGNVIVNLTAGQTLTLNQNRSPNGNLTVAQGIFDLSTFTFNRASAGGTLLINDPGTLKIGGTNSLPTNYTSHSIDNVSATVEYAGTNQTINPPNSGQSYTVLTLSGSGVKTFSGANSVLVLLSIQGTTTTAGTAPTYNAAAVLEYKGSGAQTTGIEFGGTGSNPANLTIDNTAGVTLSAAKLINGVLDLTSGYLTTSSTNLLTLGTAATAPTPAGYIDGPLAKNMPSLNNNSFTFPVGKVGRGFARNAGIITTSTGTATFKAEFFNANPKTAFSASLGAIDQISNCEYWDVSRTAGTATSRVILSWPVPANNCGSTDWGYVGNTTSLIVAHFTGGAWVNEGRLSTSGSPAAGGTITCSTILATYSPFTLGTTNGLQNPLPVKFANVKAFQKNAGVQVEWTNLTEKDVTRYVVERSSNGVSFSPVAEVLARGNQSNAEQYASFDANPVSGANYYRVTAIEITGKTIYSNIMKVDMGQQDKVLSLYPNPVKNHQVNFTFSSQRGAYSINVYNSNGQVVFSKMLQHDGGAITQMIELPASVKTGVYNLKVSGDGFSSSKPFIVQ